MSVSVCLFSSLPQAERSRRKKYPGENQKEKNKNEETSCLFVSFFLFFWEETRGAVWTRISTRRVNKRSKFVSLNRHESQFCYYVEVPSSMMMMNRQVGEIMKKSKSRTRYVKKKGKKWQSVWKVTWLTSTWIETNKKLGLVPFIFSLPTQKWFLFQSYLVDRRKSLGENGQPCRWTFAVHLVDHTRTNFSLSFSFFLFSSSSSSRRSRVSSLAGHYHLLFFIFIYLDISPARR